MDEDFKRQLDRIEHSLASVHDHLRRLNGQVAKHSQSLYGVDGRGGMLDDVRNLFKVVERFAPGMTSTKTMWAAVGSIAAMSAVVVSLVIGLT